MIDASTLILTLGSIGITGAVVILVVWMIGKTNTTHLAQLEEGYRQAICSADEFSNKLMAFLDARAHAAYRQYAGVTGKPPTITNQDRVDPPPKPRVTRNGSAVPPDPATILAAQQHQQELEELAKQNAIDIATGADYGSKEPP